MIRPFGEAALLVEVEDAERAQSLAASIRATPIGGVTDVIPGLRSVLVELDPSSADGEMIGEAVSQRLAARREPPPAGQVHVIPVTYGGEGGPDLEEVAGLVGLTPEEVVARHTAAEHRVLFLGFAPGFAYLGGLPDALHVPRLATPRTTTPAGSVAIAESMSGIYPDALPGGWRVIGRTDVRLFDPRRDPPALLAPGDVVRFEPET